MRPETAGPGEAGRRAAGPWPGASRGGGARKTRSADAGDVLPAAARARSPPGGDGAGATEMPARSGI